jgi:hypothetical protein
MNTYEKKRGVPAVLQVVERRLAPNTVFASGNVPPSSIEGDNEHTCATNDHSECLAAQTRGRTAVLLRSGDEFNQTQCSCCDHVAPHLCAQRLPPREASGPALWHWRGEEVAHVAYIPRQLHLAPAQQQPCKTHHRHCQLAVYSASAYLIVACNDLSARPRPAPQHLHPACCVRVKVSTQK